MTKADLIDSLYEHVKLSKKDSTEIVELVLERLKTTLEEGEKVMLSGFGAFSVRVKQGRVWLNPQTGAQLRISPRRVLSFRASDKLKAALNAPGRGSSR